MEKLLCEYYHILTDGQVQCDLCPHTCILHNGQHGICGSRTNVDGELRSEVYGRPCALAVDPIEKKPLLHFLPGSECLSLACTGCNLRCKNCQNYDISQALPEDVKSAEMTPEDIVDYAIRFYSRNKAQRHHSTDTSYEGTLSIAYTYTEPLTYYEYIRDIAALAHQHGLKNILVSAGYINQKPLSGLAPLLDAANIDLKSFSNDIYRHINGATLQPVLDTLITLKQNGVWLEITNLLIPTVNDDMQMIRQMCRWLVENRMADCPLHFSRFFPMYRMRELYPTPLTTLIHAREIAKEEGMRYVYIGNATDIRGEDTYCPYCGELLVERNGFYVVSNRMAKDGLCPKCGNVIAGKW
jgi:pyruvate formate lyase activating enzyme